MYVGPWLFLPPTCPRMPGCHPDEEYESYGGKWHRWKLGGCRVEMEPGHLAFSGSLLCPLSRTVDFKHDVADANPQTLIYLPRGGHYQKLWGGQRCRLCAFLGGDRIYLLWIGQPAGNFCSSRLYGLRRAFHSSIQTLVWQTQVWGHDLEVYWKSSLLVSCFSASET